MTNTNTTSPLAQMVRDCQSEGLVDPKSIAAAMARSIAAQPVADAMGMFSGALYYYVEAFMSRERSRILNTAPKRRPDAATVGNSRMARIANTFGKYTELLGQSILVNGEWKLVANCNRMELTAYADSLDEKANALHQNAEKYRFIASQLVDDQVTAASLIEECA